MRATLSTVHFKGFSRPGEETQQPAAAASHAAQPAGPSSSLWVCLFCSLRVNGSRVTLVTGFFRRHPVSRAPRVTAGVTLPSPEAEGLATAWLDPVCGPHAPGGARSGLPLWLSRRRLLSTARPCPLRPRAHPSRACPGPAVLGPGVTPR